MSTYTSKQGDRVDELIWRHTGRDKQLVEEVLDRTPGLARKAWTMPTGTVVHVPDDLLNPIQFPKQRKHLW